MRRRSSGYSENVRSSPQRLQGKRKDRAQRQSRPKVGKKPKRPTVSRPASLEKRAQADRVRAGSARPTQDANDEEAPRSAKTAYRRIA